MMNKELERLITSIQALKQIFDDLGLDANVKIEYKKDLKETINVYEKQIIKDINLYDCQLSDEEIEMIYFISHYARKEKILNDKDEDTLMNVIIKLDKQKEMLENEIILFTKLDRFSRNS